MNMGPTMRLTIRRVLVLAVGGGLLGLTAFAMVGVSDSREPNTPGLSAPTNPAPPTNPAAPASRPPGSSEAGSSNSGAPTATTTTPTTATTAPTPTSTSVPPRGELVISATGDVNTDIGYIPALATEGHAHAWTGLDGLFAEDDLTIINLECAPSEEGSALGKTFEFRCDLDSLPVMAEAGVDVVNLGNNHSQDYGKAAMLDGREKAAAAGLNPVGVGANSTEAAAPAMFEINGWKVAVIGFGGVFPSLDWFATEESPGMANGDDVEYMAAAVRAAAEKADIVVVTIHWGVELDLEPTDGDRALAEAMIEAGADMIFGHHPHRLQPLEIVDGVPVAWSLGNFVWPNFSQAGSTTAVAQVTVSPDGSVTACLLDAFITSPGHPELTGDVRCQP